jgi:lysophospholipase L1-like esterase
MVRARIPVAAVLALSLPGAVAAAKTKIACVGASTTSGDGSSAGHHYPDELQRLEGTDAEVRNFGASGTTMLRAVSASYWNTTQFTQALAYQPDIAIIWFGGNDAKPENWTTHKGEFLGDYEAMIRMFQALPSHPRTYVVLSLLTRDTEGIPKAVVDNEVVPLCRQAAAETGSGVVDVHDDLASHPEYFPDGIHPDDMGTVAVAKLVYAVISAPPDAAAPDGAGDGPLADATPAEAPSPSEGGAAGSSPPLPTAADAGTGSDAMTGGPSTGGSGPPSSGGASGGTGGAPKMYGGSTHGGCRVAGNAAPDAAALLLLLGAATLAATRRGRGLRRAIPNRERGGQP